MSRPSKRADILKAGVAVIHRNGYAASSVDAIVEAAGVPKGSFFGHFGSKENFTIEALEAYSSAWEDHSKRVLAADKMDSNQKLDALLRFVPRGSSNSKRYDGCMIGNVSLEMANHSEPLRQQAASLLHRWAVPFETVIAGGQKDGYFTNRMPAAKLARFIVNLFQGFALRSKVDRNDLSFAEFREAVLALLSPGAPTLPHRYRKRN